MHHSEDLSFKEGVDKLNLEAAGLLRCEVIRPADVGPLTYAALAGDSDAIVRLSAVLDSAVKIKALARKKAAICLCCPRSVRDPHATLAILIAASSQPTVALASAVCDRCSAGESEALLSRVATAYQACWPNLRCVEVTHPGGGRA
jgi:hypothetical protein